MGGEIGRIHEAPFLRISISQFRVRGRLTASGFVSEERVRRAVQKPRSLLARSNARASVRARARARSRFLSRGEDHSVHRRHLIANLSHLSRSPINLTTALTVGPPGMLKSVSSAISRSTLLKTSMGRCGLPRRGESALETRRSVSLAYNVRAR